jgi:hypothetical protein
MTEDDMIKGLESKREEIYREFCNLAEAYYGVVRELFPDQSEAEGHFLPLWRRLAALFESQAWDYGEFRPMDWNEAIEYIRQKRKRDAQNG